MHVFAKEQKVIRIFRYMRANRTGDMVWDFDLVTRPISDQINLSI